ncbi:MAG: hypothetical protein EXX96DRAFT_549663 [Benjaminiella poitrasii]|nr:MAG: hypothetical protein EXX96DRAFT_549663 [Benjaminiella poitrasii]
MFKAYSSPNVVRSLTTAAANHGSWQPKKRVSRQTMEKIRTLANNQNDVYDIKRISSEFKLSHEAVRRILKSNYIPTSEAAERQERNRYKAMGERRREFAEKKQR